LPSKVIVEASRLLRSSADGRWLRRNVSLDPIGAAGGMRESPHLGKKSAGEAIGERIPADRLSRSRDLVSW
jgi:hypothetical protein